MSRTPGSETIWIRTAAPVAGRFGAKGVAPAPVEVENCAIIPRTAEGERGTVIITGLEIWAPAGTRVSAIDQIDARGETWDVEGQPGVYVNRRGVEKGVRIMVERVGASTLA